MNPVVDLTVDALCAFRLTRLVVKDDITASLRMKAERAAMRSDVEDGVAAKLKTLINCPWCMGWWCALAVPFIPSPIRRALALSAVVGILSEHYSN